MNFLEYLQRVQISCAIEVTYTQWWDGEVVSGVQELVSVPRVYSRKEMVTQSLAAPFATRSSPVSFSNPVRRHLKVQRDRWNLTTDASFLENQIGGQTAYFMGGGDGLSSVFSGAQQPFPSWISWGLLQRPWGRPGDPYFEYWNRQWLRNNPSGVVSESLLIGSWAQLGDEENPYWEFAGQVGGQIVDLRWNSPSVVPLFVFQNGDYQQVGQGVVTMGVQGV